MDAWPRWTFKAELPRHIACDCMRLAEVWAVAVDWECAHKAGWRISILDPAWGDSVDYLLVHGHVLAQA